MFKLVNEVLVEIFEGVSGANEAEKVATVKGRLGELSSIYSDVMNAKKPLDYKSPDVRCAYVFKYVTSHADLIYQLLRRFEDFDFLASQEKVTVTCVGGGPGSDVVGVLKFAQAKGRKNPLSCFVLDREQAWADSWSDVHDKIDLGFSLHSQFQPLDVTNPESYRYQRKYLTADLFTFSFFFSEIYAFRDQADAFLLDMFASAKKGAIFLIVDFRNEVLNAWFDGVASKAGLVVLESGEERMTPSADEQAADIGDFIEKFNHRPKLVSQTAWRVWQR